MGISEVRKRKFLNPHFVLQPISVSYFTCLCFKYMHETVAVEYPPPPLHICVQNIKKETNQKIQQIKATLLG